ncbi:UDP-sugar transporter UST74c [Brachionus plicatilis]|uniref:UDP-sugar transporter UST74c n=1 Tax=Brachionus plicatilis TaxID=10195 RepID=A0A3M7QTC8_BRAPC|nr:UDP-sugar transporter UST74c [Brachionus plicatilis]
MLIERFGSAAFYGVASLMITFANKIVLTSYRFTSFQALALGQITITLVLLRILKKLKLIKLANFDPKTAWNIMPLAIFYFGNILFGLGGTKSLNLPMFSVLRRFSVLMTMYGEQYILRKKKSSAIQMSIYAMILGALVAASDDLTFDVYGYTFITLNNFFTTANGIYTKKKLDNMKMGEYDLLYYNAILTLFPMIILSIYSGELEKLQNYDEWFNPGFWFFFLLSSLMGFILNFSWMLCTRFNSPLTTTVTGCLKNILVTYLGMLIGGDYIFSSLNFVGLTISSVASVLYSYLTFSSSKPVEEVKPKQSKCTTLV